MPSSDDFQIGDIVWPDLSGDINDEEREAVLEAFPLDYHEYAEDASLTVVRASESYVNVRRTDFLQAICFSGSGMSYESPMGGRWSSWSVHPMYLRHDTGTKPSKRKRSDYIRSYIK